MESRGLRHSITANKMPGKGDYCPYMWEQVLSSFRAGHQDQEFGEWLTGFQCLGTQKWAQFGPLSCKYILPTRPISCLSCCLLLLVPSCSQIMVTCYPLAFATVPLPGQGNTSAGCMGHSQDSLQASQWSRTSAGPHFPSMAPCPGSSWPKPGSLRAPGSEGLMPSSSSPTGSQLGPHTSPTQLCCGASVRSWTPDFLF